MANTPKGSPGSKRSGEPDFITLEKAIEIVLDLARQNIIEDPEMEDQAARQEAAIDTVEDFFVNNVFDGTEMTQPPPLQLTPEQYDDVHGLVDYVLDDQSAYEYFVDWLCEEGSGNLTDEELAIVKTRNRYDPTSEVVVEKVALKPDISHCFAAALRLKESLVIRRQTDSIQSSNTSAKP